MSAVLTKKRAKIQMSLAIEAGQLTRRIAREMGAALSISEGAFANWPLRYQLDRAVCILGRLGDPDTFEPVEGTPDGDLPSMLQAAKEALDLEITAIARDAHMSLGGALHDGILARHIRDRVIEVIDAFEGGADGVNQLRQLATYDGAMGNGTVAIVDVTNGAAPSVTAPRPEGEKDPSPPLHNAVAVYWALAMDAGKDAPHGLHWMAEHAAEEVDAAIADMDFSRAENASSLLAQAAALSEIVIEADQDYEMPLLPPALSLLERGRAHLDDWIQSMARARMAA